MYHGSSYPFRKDPQKVSEYFQQLGSMRERCKLTHWGFWAKMLSKYKKIAYILTLFGVRYK